MTEITNLPYRDGVPFSTATPFTYREGVTNLELIHALKTWAINVIPDLNSVLGQFWEQYTTDHAAILDDIIATKDEWQALFTQFMADVVSQLEGLNDQAVANLVRNEASQLRGALDERYEPRWRSNTNEQFVSHDFFGITGVGNEYDKIVNALAVMPAGSTLTIPDDFTIDIGDNTLNINRPVSYSGGRIKSTRDKAVIISSSNVNFENVKITGNGVAKGYLISNETLGVIGEIDAYIENVHLRNVHINDVRDSGFYTLYVKNFSMNNCSIKDYVYAGIGIRSTEDFEIVDCVVSDLIRNDGLHDRWGYGISVSDRIALEPYRSRNGRIRHNVVRNVRRGAGIETHGGYNIEFLYNEIYGCRNSMTLTTGNQTRPFTFEKCKAIGNYVDAEGYDGATLSNGISIGGGDESNPVSSDCIVALNTFVNTTRPVSWPAAYRKSDYIDWKKSFVGLNTSDNVPVTEMEGTNFTTGWLPVTDFGSILNGFSSNPGFPLMIRLTHDDLGYHAEINGVAGLAAPTADGREIVRITDSRLHPPVPLILGLTQTINGDQTNFLTITTDGYIATQLGQNGTYPLTRNVPVMGRWDCKAGRWDGPQ